jgi:DUF1009 family protein
LKRLDKTKDKNKRVCVRRNTNVTYDAADELEESDDDIGVGMVAVDLLIVAVEAADRADLAAETTLILVPKRNEINNTKRKVRRGCMTNRFLIKESE